MTYNITIVVVDTPRTISEFGVIIFENLNRGWAIRGAR